jgi:hypothetical protein
MYLNTYFFDVAATNQKNFVNAMVSDQKIRESVVSMIDNQVQTAHATVNLANHVEVQSVSKDITSLDIQKFFKSWSFWPNSQPTTQSE